MIVTFYTGLTGTDLHEILWGAVRHLLEIGLNVVCIVADGAKSNRKFFRDHAHPDGTKDGIVYRARNIYDPSKFIYFMSDVPHLMKTTRNCWSNSFINNGSRLLWVCNYIM